MKNLLVVFSHGKESGPWGSKIKALAKVAERLGGNVISVDYREYVDAVLGVYQHQVYRHHRLPEGAIVAELTRLIDSNIASEQQAHCERMYREFVKPGKQNNNERVDIAIVSGSNLQNVNAMIEVKRASSLTRTVEEDMVALSEFKKRKPKTHTFLVAVSQAKLPRKWVSSKGTAIKKKMETDTTDAQGIPYKYKVVRVLKAARSFRSIKNASYCCLIEVL